VGGANVASVVRWTSFLVSLVAFVAISAFLAARAYGWYRNVGITPSFIVNSVGLGVLVLVAAVFPFLLAFLPGSVARSSKAGFLALAVGSLVWFLIAGVLSLVLAGGF
jgi:hypothetical protein